MNYLLLDVGSTFIKAALFDVENLRLSEIKKWPAPPFIEGQHPFKREIDSESLVESVRGMVELLSRDRSLQGVLFAGQMHGFILTDPDDKPLTNFISWQDSRVLEINPQTKNSFLADYLKLVDREAHQRTGSPNRAGPSAYNLHTLLQSGEYSGVGHFYTLGAYLIHRLTGEPGGCHLTQAAATGLVDIESRDWSPELLAALRLDHTIFPGILAEFQPAASMNLRGRTVSLFPMVGDQQAALAGSLAQTGDLVINIGTGSQVCRIEDRLEYGPYEVRPYFGGKSLRTISRLPGGRALNVLYRLVEDIAVNVAGTKNLDPAETWKILNRLAEKQTDLKSSVTFFKTDPQSPAGSISNITETNLSAGDLIKSAYNNMAENYFKCGSTLGAPIRRVLCLGGPAVKSAPLRKSLSDRFKVEIHTPPFAEDTLCGLARIALQASGRCQSFEATAEAIQQLRIA